MTRTAGDQGAQRLDSTIYRVTRCSWVEKRFCRILREARALQRSPRNVPTIHGLQSVWSSTEWQLVAPSCGAK
jgi:hypothetical protein